MVSGSIGQPRLSSASDAVATDFPFDFFGGGEADDFLADAEQAFSAPVVPVLPENESTVIHANNLQLSDILLFEQKP